MKSEHQKRVEEFMEGAGQKIPSKPTMPDEKTRFLRARLILEECLETIDALGVTPYLQVSSGNGGPIEMEDVSFVPNGHEDLVKAVDGFADISVVTIGSASACGVNMTPILEEVDSNNLLKIKNGTRNKHGKLVKPPNHPKPNIEKILNEMAE